MPNYIYPYDRDKKDVAKILRLLIKAYESLDALTTKHSDILEVGVEQEIDKIKKQVQQLIAHHNQDWKR